MLDCLNINERGRKIGYIDFKTALFLGCIKVLFKVEWICWWNLCCLKFPRFFSLKGFNKKDVGKNKLIFHIPPPFHHSISIRRVGLIRFRWVSLDYWFSWLWFFFLSKVLSLLRIFYASMILNFLNKISLGSRQSINLKDNSKNWSNVVSQATRTF